MVFFNKLKSNSTFPVSYNLLPHYSAAGMSQASLMKCVGEALDDGRIRTFFLSDKPLHSQNDSSLQLAEKIVDAGGEPIVSLALTYDSRDVVLEKVRRYFRAGVRHFFFVSGEYPLTADDRQKAPLYDLDSVQLLMLLAELGISGASAKTFVPDSRQTENMSIVKGCAVSPFKALESEQIWQYEKLKRKVEVGADFVITQLGYDLRKFDELLRFCTLHNFSTPLVANIFITDRKAASMFRQGELPGVAVPERLLQTIKAESSDPLTAGKKILTRAAMTLTVLRGLGYNGALIGDRFGDFKIIRQVLDEAERLQTDWQDFLPELDYSGTSFYYFQKDSRSGLNTDEPSPVSPKKLHSVLYTFSYFVDWMFYLPRGPFFNLTGRFCCFCSDRKIWYRFLWLQEFLAKGLLYGCRMCGDCVLYASGFLCYQSGCPKKMMNGPCGGSMNGFCELYPGKKKCHWVSVYGQLKGVSEHISYAAPPIPARDNTLNRTSSWVNYFLGRDHRKMHFKPD